MSSHELPRVGDRVGAVCGPGQAPENDPGTVTSVVDARFGPYAQVHMDSGREDTCHSLTTVGIGWHRLAEPIAMSDADWRELRELECPHLWCGHCEAWREVKPRDGDEDLPDDVMFWQCGACGELILCDECGEPWNGIHGRNEASTH
jgi:hypothetical protein